MKNILSYTTGTSIKGREIKAWIRYHIENNTEYTYIANKMVKYLNIADDVGYMICKGNYQASERQFCVYKFKTTQN